MLPWPPVASMTSRCAMLAVCLQDGDPQRVNGDPLLGPKGYPGGAQGCPEGCPEGTQGFPWVTRDYPKDTRRVPRVTQGFLSQKPRLLPATCCFLGHPLLPWSPAASVATSCRHPLATSFRGHLLPLWPSAVTRASLAVWSCSAESVGAPVASLANRTMFLETG